jgi:secondary thiamine-phosphate synthase enzyme
MPTVFMKTLKVQAPRRGLHEITAEVARAVRDSGVRQGICALFIRHTSASLTIQENYDPSVRDDLEGFLSRLVPEGDPSYTHTLEGPDDMPSHIKAALTQVSLTIPVLEGAPAFGTWQGIYLWEHRDRPSPREIVVSVF